MTFKKIGILAVLVAALGAYLYWVEIPAAEREATKEKLVAADKDAITGIQLTFPDRDIALAKVDGKWRLTKPVDAPADEPTVTSIVTALTGAEVQKSLDEPPTDLAPFGLDAPSPVVKITTAAGEQPALHVGKTTKIGGKAYVRRGDDPKVYLTLSTLPSMLGKQVKDLRDKQILTYADDDVTAVAATKPDGKTTTLAKKDKDAWVVGPGDHVADLTEVKSYLSQIRTTRAIDFVADAPGDLATYGLDKPKLAITITTGKDKPVQHTLLLGGERTEGSQKQVFAKAGDNATVYAIGDWALRNLDKDIVTLRDKTVLGFDADRPARVVLERKEGPGVTLARDGASWKLETTDGKPPKESIVSRFVDDLRELRGSGIAADSATALGTFGLDAPDVRISLTDKDGQPIGVLMAAKKDGKYFAMREGGPTVFELRDYMYQRVDKQQRDFVEDPTAPKPAASMGEPGDDEEIIEDEEE